MPQSLLDGVLERENRRCDVFAIRYSDRLACDNRAVEFTPLAGKAGAAAGNRSGLQPKPFPTSAHAPATSASCGLLARLAKLNMPTGNSGSSDMNSVRRHAVPVPGPRGITIDVLA